MDAANGIPIVLGREKFNRIAVDNPGPSLCLNRLSECRDELAAAGFTLICIDIAIASSRLVSIKRKPPARMRYKQQHMTMLRAQTRKFFRDARKRENVETLMEQAADDINIQNAKARLIKCRLYYL
nr:hypothetical protein [Trinickia violacea]